jgi:DNA-binding NtrC family response regulator
VSDRVTPALLEFYERAKRHATNAIDAGVDWHDFREAVLIAVIDAALERAKGNKSQAARLLNMHRNMLGRYCRTQTEHKMLYRKPETRNA